MDVGAPELLIILVVILVLFGGAKLPQLARSLGEAQREFRRGHERPDEDAPAKPAAAETVTLTKAELEALLAEREQQALRRANPTDS